MKLFVGAMCLIVGLSIVAGAGSFAAGPTTMPTTVPIAVNKFCPVTKEAVDPTVETVVYKGMTVGFCCDDCVKEFKAHPDKYAANLK